MGPGQQLGSAASGRHLHLADVQCVEYKHVVVVFRQRDNITFRGNLQAAAAADLHIGTLKLACKRRDVVRQWGLLLSLLVRWRRVLPMSEPSLWKTGTWNLLP